MPKSAKHLLIGSTETYSGKSTTILGMAQQLKDRGLDLAYGKPLGTVWESEQPETADEDVRFIAQTLGLPANRIQPTLLMLDASTIQKRLAGEDQKDYAQALKTYQQMQECDLVLLEGPGTMAEGALFNLSLLQVAQTLEATVLLVVRFDPLYLADRLLAARQHLGNHLLGVLINDIPAEQLDMVASILRPFLESQGIAVLGLLPRSDLLRSVSVGELAHQLNAEILCRPDRLDLMVESLTIGAMNVSSAMKYFQKGRNMAVVTGGDRTDIQLAALETSTQCLILTGHMPPSAPILSRAEDLEIPVLSVDLDTLTTVEIVDRAFGQVRLQEPIKVQCVCQMMAQHFDVDRLLKALGLEPAATHS